MSSVLSSKGLVLATSMAVSAGTVILFDLLREKYFAPTQFQESPPAKQLLKSCLTSSSQKMEKKNKKKEKRVKFADDVKDSRGNGELYRKLRKKSSKAEATCCGNEILGYNGLMPANRVALYNGILKDRVQRIGCSY
ncbi:unnamed protein product [Fraxinus pennsylvanica]|uniref:Uncharacterized protein n=1 Tax=Fraxinus pennsylvanica TaxID=56036 RepID=A0AAD1ZAW9_9LAMI|nr:unnamed protein product [Fraxinus pennsylvanica]